MNYNELAKRIHENAVKHGFWDEGYNIEHYLMLVITEIGEMVQADRIGKRTSHDAKTYFHPMITRRVFKINFVHLVKGSVEDEMADAVIRLLDLAGGKGITIDENRTVAPTYHERTFTDDAFSLCRTLVSNYAPISHRINYAIAFLREWAKHLDIDLEWHIEQKMCYNETRPVRHGKRY